MIVRQQVKNAMRAAGRVQCVDGVWSPRHTDDLVAGRRVDGAAPVRPEHGVHFLSRKKLVLPPHYVAAESIDELRSFAHAWHDLAGVAVPTDSIEDQLTHESRHRWAAAAIGALTGARLSDDFYALKVYGCRTEADSRVWQFEYVPAGLHTTVAGYAAILAHPTEPSLEDLQMIEGLNFTGVDEVRRHAQGSGLPLPLSYAGADEHGVF